MRASEQTQQGVPCDCHDSRKTSGRREALLKLVSAPVTATLLASAAGGSAVAAVATAGDLSLQTLDFITVPTRLCFIEL